VSPRWPIAGEVRSIEVVRVSSLGDVVLCEPVLRAIARRYPSAELTFVTRPPYGGLFAGHPQVARVVDVDADVDAAPPDLCVDLHGRWATRRRAARARVAIVWTKRDGLDLLRAAAGLPMRARPVGFDDQVTRMLVDLGLTEGEGTRAAVLHPRVRAAHRIGVVLLPGSRWPTKMWPETHWRALGRALLEAGLQVTVLGGPGDAPVLERLALGGLDVLDAGRDLERAMTRLTGFTCAVGNDSGLTHLAAAVGTPTVVLFGPTRASRWAPQGDAVTVVARPPPCSPCSDYGARPCRQARRLCLDDLTVAQVLSAVSSVCPLTRNCGIP
jgi:ADP-heptose:LPS heptosyltransferase